MNIIETSTESNPSPNAARAARLSQAGPKENARRLGRRARALLFGSLIVAPVVIGSLIAARYLQFQNLASETERMTVPTVQVVRPTPGPSETEITLPGNLAPYNESSIYARTNGYLKDWKTDLGAKVAAGQLMAEISAHDVDAQLNQARANLAQAQANQTIAQLNFSRQQDLLAKAVSSQQEFDQSHANFDSTSAAVKAAQANVQNLTVQQDFQKIVAPFPGVVTLRTVDVGDLVTTGTDSTANNAKALFHLARTDILRVFIDVPQAYSPAVSNGTKAYLVLQEFPGEKFEGRITNISGAIDPATRTLLTEVQVPNADGRLFPGAYAQVHLVLPVKPVMVIPTNTLLFRSAGTQIGIVDGNGIVHLRNVTLGHDFGTTVEATQGVGPEDRIVVDPSDSLADNAKVNVEERDTKQ
jgi:membrane fusion protein (multidrug efflux system)